MAPPECIGWGDGTFLREYATHVKFEVGFNGNRLLGIVATVVSFFAHMSPRPFTWVQLQGTLIYSSGYDSHMHGIVPFVLTSYQGPQQIEPMHANLRPDDVFSFISAHLLDAALELQSLVSPPEA
ncbi:hypothetical protein PAXRUDRAFT_17517 [Paxillus rubicundulus Ve08.2h10]|uniref:Uncharacterized protein n=1 Tax=Paxillus rubicundulus Ve08.2h10 TaxID=930991 RepID=A0A0D0DA97_9AGAM|nr:hypothetical protein PAXRUDRAFT_17517 [Paxillus rubicundulus Ve08.2h10]